MRSRTAARISSLLGTAITTVVVAIAAAAAPAQAAPVSITADATYPNSCNDTDDQWEFWIRDVGGDTGIDAPESIVADLADGGTIEIPLTEVDSSEVDGSVASYLTSSTQRLTGEATAQIDETWISPHSEFWFVSGPCVEIDATAELATDVVEVGGTFTITGQVTSKAGDPLAGRQLLVRMHSIEALGKGKVYNVETGADGRYELQVEAVTPGYHSFSPQIYESGPGAGGFGEFRKDYGDMPFLTGWALPPSVPESSGTLASSAGDTFEGVTVVSGSGFLPGTEVGIALYSAPVLLGSATVNESGGFGAEVTIPEGVTGEHTLVAIGAADSGGVQVLTLPITVPTESTVDASGDGDGSGVGDDELAATGSRTAMVLGLGVLLLVAGASTFLVARRRRVRFTAT